MSEEKPTNKEREYMSRYERALHAMQSGVAMEMQQGHRQSATEPKHLRVGVNAAMCDHAALVGLLREKGVITDEEYFKALAESMEREVSSYEERLSESFGRPVTLG